MSWKTVPTDGADDESDQRHMLHTILSELEAASEACNASPRKANLIDLLDREILSHETVFIDCALGLGSGTFKVDSQRRPHRYSQLVIFETILEHLCRLTINDSSNLITERTQD